jgi:hypothetical protein
VQHGAHLCRRQVHGITAIVRVHMAVTVAVSLDDANALAKEIVAGSV